MPSALTEFFLLPYYAILAVDISSVQPDLTIPKLVDGAPTPGARVKQTHPDDSGSSVYHVLYLPQEWKSGNEYPLIVEYAGNGPYRNTYGDVSTGRVEGSKLGYGLAAGKECLWLCLPYLNEAGDANVQQWWGDPPHYDPSTTVAYAKKVIPWICAHYGGDPDRVLLCGFSRGAIACNYIGLHDDDIAKLWCGFIAYSHYDGVRENWSFAHDDRASAKRRLERLGHRPQFILHEQSTNTSTNLAATRRYLQSTGCDLSRVTFLETGFRNHNDAWILRPSPTRKALRQWFAGVVRLTNSAKGAAVQPKLE